MDPFELLGTERRFDLDLAAVEKTHRELSRALHPDRFASSGASERRATLEKAASVNEAWRILRDPIRRAEALFRLAGASVGETNEPSPNPAFLMEMMEEREGLAEARAVRDLPRVRRLAGAIASRSKAVEAKLAAAFGPGVAPGAALPLVGLLGELRFYRRFLDEVAAIEEEAEELAASASAEVVP
jgi:molecular chaperone HscB